MIQTQQTTLELNLRHIADLLILNGTLTVCPGLIHGKTGIAVFFFHYARYTDNELFADYALELIEEIQDQLYANIPVDYEQGIAGIGIGIDYLINKNFLETDDDIFEEFDQRMYRATMYDLWLDFSMYDGLIGYGRYWVMRLRRHPTLGQAQDCLSYIIRCIDERLSNIFVRDQAAVYYFLHDLNQMSNLINYTEMLEICRIRAFQAYEDDKRDVTYLRNSTIGNIIRLHQYSHYWGYASQDEIDCALKQIPDLNMMKLPVGMGLLTGYAGEGMLRLTALDQTDISWINLL